MNSPLHITRNRCLGVIMPIFNEAGSLRQIVEKVLSRPEVGELIMIDDGSDDGTWNRILELKDHDPRILAMRREANGGKGEAIRLGLKQARSEILVIQDADLEYSPDDYPVLLELILSGEADVVYGSRFMTAGRRLSSGSWHALGNRMLTLLSNCFTGLELTDMETCYKMFRKSVIERIELREKRFGFEPEFTAKAAKIKAIFREVPISYTRRRYREGKKIGWLDAVSAIRCILAYR